MGLKVTQLEVKKSIEFFVKLHYNHFLKKSFSMILIVTMKQYSTENW